MPKRTSKPDVVQNAKRTFDALIANSETTLTVMGNPALLSEVMRAMGSKGGKIGGKRRLKTMTPEHRQAVARQAAQTRWAKTAKARAKAKANK